MLHFYLVLIITKKNYNSILFLFNLEQLLVQKQTNMQSSIGSSLKAQAKIAKNVLLEYISPPSDFEQPFFRVFQRNICLLLIKLRKQLIICNYKQIFILCGHSNKDACKLFYLLPGFSGKKNSDHVKFQSNIEMQLC